MKLYLGGQTEGSVTTNIQLEKKQAMHVIIQSKAVTSEYTLQYFYSENINL